jgi:hypothetical protein
MSAKKTMAKCLGGWDRSDKGGGENEKRVCFHIGFTVA